ncbi:ABC transporter ATP-binding protein [Rhizobium sp. P32RR-XVIII]|uniref:ABC transporter ATP-binding protein n=1 Tax=Rhizobium sp. P32RR-XVIII TaxID=2726738 RepID=UPI001457951A|nr:ABC transporter ATP-binding protein [Rhizobium sp. P32RR-XVIII]NLS06028.1 ABC transporter ATP-binding protein [Rhizobium sp. P32RR-XVIII]
MITIEQLKKGFPTGSESIFAVSGVSLNVDRGEMVTLLGPSGCGKTTTLRCIAGLERASSGRIVIDGQTVADPQAGIFVPPNRRSLGMVFQSYAIWPHMTVLENVAYALEGRGIPKAERRKVAMEALEVVRLAHLADRPAPRLSGGQQQRVAIARALVGKPKALLFDEPLSNLDAQLRGEMRAELSRLQRQIGLTSIYVTHDQAEALAMSDWIVVMKDGKVVEHGRPTQIYRKPRNAFTASFIGTTNFVSGRILEVDAASHVVLVDTPLGKFRGTDPTESLKIGDDAQLSLRPEDLRVASAINTSGINHFSGTIDFALFVGAVMEVDVQANGIKVRCLVGRGADPAIGDPITLEIAPEACIVLPANDRLS